MFPEDRDSEGRPRSAGRQRALRQVETLLSVLHSDWDADLEEKSSDKVCFGVSGPLVNVTPMKKGPDSDVGMVDHNSEGSFLESTPFRTRLENSPVDRDSTKQV